MRKVLFTVGIISLLSLSAINANAATQDSNDEKNASFELTQNTDGTLLVKAADLQFGKHTIQSTDITAKATNDTSISVTEFSGEKPGWNLSVSMSKFSDGTNTASGTQLFFPNVTPTTTTTGAGSYAPVLLGTKTAFIGTATGVIVNDDDLKVPLAGAKAGNGYGDWLLPFKDDDGSRVQLKVPTGQKIGNYTSTLTYTIEDTPIP